MPVGGRVGEEKEEKKRRELLSGVVEIFIFSSRGLSRPLCRDGKKKKKLLGVVALRALPRPPLSTPPISRRRLHSSQVSSESVVFFSICYYYPLFAHVSPKKKSKKKRRESLSLSLSLSLSRQSLSVSILPLELSLSRA